MLPSGQCFESCISSFAVGLFGATDRTDIKKGREEEGQMKAIRKKMMRWFFYFKFSVTFIYVVLMGVVCACFAEKSEDEQGSVLSFHGASLRDPEELGS